jgi:excisionase family DNA binding protein
VVDAVVAASARQDICDQESIVHPQPDNAWNRPAVTIGRVAVPLDAGLPDPGTKPYLRTSEVAELLHAAPKTVSNWATQGKLPYARTLGGHRRYPTSQILELVCSLTSTLSPAQPTPARHGERMTP